MELNVRADQKQKDIDVWEQGIQGKTHVYETLIKAPEQQIGKLRQESKEKQNQFTTCNKIFLFKRDGVEGSFTHTKFLFKH